MFNCIESLIDASDALSTRRGDWRTFWEQVRREFEPQFDVNPCKRIKENRPYWPQYDLGIKVINPKYSGHLEYESRRTFDLSPFPGNCCWLIMHTLEEHSLELLHIQDALGTTIAEKLQYGGLIVSHTLRYKFLSELGGLRYEQLNKGDFNPHSSRTNLVFRKILERRAGCTYR